MGVGDSTRCRCGSGSGSPTSSSGILVETRWQGDRCAWAVVGVGINVRNALPAELAESATRLADWLGDGLDPIDLAAPLAVAITTAARGGPLDDLELAAWRTRDALIGHPVSAPLAGIADGITASGALVVRSPDGTRHACPAGVVAITD